jgi:hypothetical protein
MGATKKKRRWVHESTDQNKKTFFVGLSVNIHYDRTRMQTFSKKKKKRRCTERRKASAGQLIFSFF